MKMLDNEATYLGQLGEDVTDVGQLWEFALMQADGLSPVPALATATDLNVVVPGQLSLDFSRVYRGSDRSRAIRSARSATAGPTTGSIRCRSASDGTVTVTMPSGEQRVFQPDSRPGGGYFDQPGDYGILTAGGGGTFSCRRPTARSKPSTPTARSTTSRTPTATASPRATPAASSPASPIRRAHR